MDANVISLNKKQVSFPCLTCTTFVPTTSPFTELQSGTKCWNMVLKIGLPSRFHLTMLVWKLQMKSHIDCAYQYCKGKGVGRVGVFQRDLSTIVHVAMKTTRSNITSTMQFTHKAFLVALYVLIQGCAHFPRDHPCGSHSVTEPSMIVPLAHAASFFLQ